MPDPRDFTGSGISAGETTPSPQSSTLAKSLSAAGFNLDGSQPLAFQIPGHANEIKTLMGDKVSQLSDLRKAQSEGIHLKDMDTRMSTLISELSELKSFVKDTLSRGVLPQYLNEKGERVDAPNAERQLTQALVRTQSYESNHEKRIEREAENKLKREERERLRVEREAQQQEDRELKERRNEYRGSLSGIRADTRVARVMAEHGGLPPAIREELEEHKKNLLEDIPELMGKYNAARESGDMTSRHIIAQDLGAANNLAKELTTVLEYGQGKQSNALNTVLKHVANVVTTLGVAGMVSRVALTEPYQFGTRPALGVLGGQGEVGSLLSGAFGQLEEYSLGLNQQTLGAGAGLMATGLLMGGGVGAGLAGIGALTGVLGATGQGDDIWRALPWTANEDDIIAQNIVQTVADPQRLVDNFMSSRTGLMSAGGLATENMGYNFSGGGSESTGNSILDKMMDLRGLGYSQEAMGQLLSSTALNLTGSKTDMTDFATQAGRVSSAFGVSEDSVLANMQTAQRYGSQDAGSSLYRAIGASADANGNITSYTTNVLVPALMKVTESLALQNLSRSGEELEQEVISLRTTIGSSDTQLGTLMNQNPEMMARVVNTLQAAVGQSLQNPAMLAFNLATGSTMGDIIQKKPEVIDRNLQHILNSSVASGVDFSRDDVFDGTSGLALASMASSITGISDFQLLKELLAVVQQQGSILGADGGLSDSADALMHGKDAESERVNVIIENEIGGLAASMAQQTDALLIASQSLVEQYGELQKSIIGFIQSDKILAAAEKGIADVMAKLSDWLGKGDTSGSTGAMVPGMVTEESSVAVSHNGGTGIATGYATGGYTGTGGTHQVVGAVHAGEYVISSHKVNENRETLDKIQSGESVSTPSINKSGSVTYVTLRIDGSDPETIYKRAEEATAAYIRRNRINYL